MNPQSWFTEALALHRNGNLTGAALLYVRILEVEPTHFDARHNLGLVRSQQGQTAEAIEWIGAALQINPHSPEVLCNYGNALRAAGRPEQALASYDRALAIKPNLQEGLFNRGNVLRDLNRLEDALADYDRALAVNPALAQAWNNRGNTLRDLRRPAQALASYDRALALRPGHPQYLNNRAIALHDLKQPDDALASCDQALAIQPSFAEAWNTRGMILAELQHFEEALASCGKALSADPSHRLALSGLAHSALWLCDWASTGKIEGMLKADILEGKSAIQPFTLLGYWDDTALQRRCAENYLRHILPARPEPLWRGGTRHRNGKIRIAYLSADFRNSAAAYLMAEVFERHDRERFEVTAVSFGVDDGSAMRARLVKAFDAFHDVRERSDSDVARLLAGTQTDIAVDLMGYTLGARPGILGHRPCPVQVSYLGFPGPMAADFIDYVIVDAVVLPADRQLLYDEKIVHLPHSYYPSDSTNAIAAQTLSRAEAGLPGNGFVFCCFNNNWKITAAMFDVWMRLLGGVPDSVLWLLPTSSGAAQNLRREAQRRGIDPARLVFAGRLEPAPHLARHRLADLFLDTLPYNAHTTASDALWAGLPLVTCAGESFCARVAASLLKAIGLPELVTDNLQDYEALALRLANDPELLASIRQKLAHNRLNTPLFDAIAFRRGLESAYARMVEISRDGAAPRALAIPPQQ